MKKLILTACFALIACNGKTQVSYIQKNELLDSAKDTEIEAMHRKHGKSQEELHQSHHPEQVEERHHSSPFGIDNIPGDHGVAVKHTIKY